MSAQRHEVTMKIGSPNDWAGYVNHKICVTEENLRAIHEVIEEKLETIDRERLESTPRYRLAMLFASYGWGGDISLERAWAEAGNDSRRLYLLRADDVIEQGWVHLDDLAEQEAKENAAADEDAPTESVADGYAETTSDHWVVEKDGLISWLERVPFEKLAKPLEDRMKASVFRDLEPGAARSLAAVALQTLIKEARK